MKFKITDMLNFCSTLILGVFASIIWDYSKKIYFIVYFPIVILFFIFMYGEKGTYDLLDYIMNHKKEIDQFIEQEIKKMEGNDETK